ncbi:30S ribosomal protein S17 [Planctomycetales bacterium 10988]|nr:30S ribosomal protein S17 [Planctomycetales bacterium 10988]
MPKKVLVGTVTSDKMEKTRRVEVQRLVKHPLYKKYIRRRTVCHVHDENNESGVGDKVEIIECSPRSKSKRWELIKVLAKSQLVDVAAMRAEARAKARAEKAAGQ